MNGHIVKTCRRVSDGLEPAEARLPPIPQGTYGICITRRDNYPEIDFGPPWGVQEISNADLLDAGAVLDNAARSISRLKRAWRTVLRRTLRSLGAPYLETAVYEQGLMGSEAYRGKGSFAVEAYLYQEGTRRAALALLKRAAEIARGATPATPLGLAVPDVPERSRTPWERELLAMALAFADDGRDEEAAELRKDVANGITNEHRFRAAARGVLFEDIEDRTLGRRVNEAVWRARQRRAKEEQRPGEQPVWLDLHESIATTYLYEMAAKASGAGAKKTAQLLAAAAVHATIDEEQFCAALRLAGATSAEVQVAVRTVRQRAESSTPSTT